MLIKIFNIIFLLTAPFLFIGFINKVKSFLGSRQGPPLFQPFYDFIKLLKKETVIGETTSIIFQISPVISFCAILFAGLLIPVFGHQSIINFKYNFICFCYLLGLSRFFSVMGAMDTGSSFEGMGANREVVFASLVEPGFFILLGSLAIYTQSLSFEKLFSFIAHPSPVKYLIICISSLILFIMILTESGRVPIDDPNTHLELTMIHEVMILDNSGPDLGLSVYSSSMKMVIGGSLIANLVLSRVLALSHNIMFFCLIQLILCIMIACIETVMARLRMTHIPQFIFFITALSLIIFFLIITVLN